jgi:hypothetical protein
LGLRILSPLWHGCSENPTPVHLYKEAIVVNVKCQSSKVKGMPKPKCQNSRFKTQNFTGLFAGYCFEASGFSFGYLSLGFDWTFGF